MGVATKSHPYGFIIERLFYIEQWYTCFLFHSPKLHPVKFQQKNSRGEHRQSRYWASKQQWTTRIRNNQGNQHIKNKFSHFKSTLQKISNNPSLNSVHQYTNQTIIQPLITPPWGAHLGRANAPGPGRSEDQARQDETILHDWHGAKSVVISSYQKSANPSRSRRKNLSRNEESNDTTNKNRLCRRLADTRDLKSFSEDRVWGCPRRIENLRIVRWLEWLLDFLFALLSGSFGETREIILAQIIPYGRVYKNLSMRGYGEIFLYQTDCPQSSSHQIALFWGQFYALRGMEGALSSVRPRI